MALKSYTKCTKQNSHKSLCSHASNFGLNILYLNPNDNLLKDLSYNESKQSKLVSPYISENKNKVVSQNIKTSLNRTKTEDFVSSLPLYLNINRANSDDFKNTKERPRKIKKSVLTLSNKLLPAPQKCTVSDMNDSEYFQDHKYEKETKPIRKKQLKNKRKFRRRKNVGNVSQLNYRLDCSSSSLIKNFAGDGNRKIGNRKNIKNKSVDSDLKDVWSAVKNINKFQFTPSPPISQDSDSSLEMDKNKKSLIQSSQVEKTGILNCKIDNSYSRSSFDRIIVIDKQNTRRKDMQNSGTPTITKKSPFKRKNDTKSANNSLQKTKTANNNEHNEIQKHNEQNPKLNKISLNEKNVFDEIKLWKKPDHHNSSHNIILQRSKDSNINTQNDQDLKILSVKDDDCAVHFNKVNNCNTDSSKNKLKKTSSKERKSESIRLKKSNEITKNVKEFQEGVNGITKVVLSRHKHNEDEKRIGIQQIRTPMTTKTITSLPKPKLIPEEVKKRLERMKFPIVILGKDQLSSSIEVTNCEAPQFSGLCDHIWPFMVNWVKPMGVAIKGKWRQPRNNGLDLEENKNDNNKKIKNTANNNKIKKKRPGTKIIPESQSKNRKLAVKYTNQFKKYNDNAPRVYKEVSKDASTNTSMFSLKSKTRLPVANTTNQLSSVKLWANAKRASEFIEMIIKKVRNGEYFNQDIEIFDNNNISLINKLQTDIDLSESDVPVNKEPQLLVKIRSERKNKECLDSIPGFEENLTDLEVETCNKSYIAIKHCLTNVVIKFDIVVPSQEIRNNIRFKKSLSYKPLLIQENETKIYRSDKRILHTRLPAELCSMVNDIIDFNRNFTTSKNKELKEALIVTNCDLSPTEKVNKSLVIPNISHDLNKYNRHYLKKIVYKLNKNNKQLALKPEIKIHENELFVGSCKNLNFASKTGLTNFLFFDNKKYIPLKNNEVVLENEKPICMSVQPYLMTNKQIVSAYKRFSILDMLKMLQGKNDFELGNCVPTKLELKTTLSVNYSRVTGEDFEKLKLNEDIYNTCVIQEHIMFRDITMVMLRDIKDKKYNDITISSRIKTGDQNHTFIKRNISQKLQRCKSMSNIPNNSPHRFLNNITSLQDFVKVLESAETVCSVLDKDLERIILSFLATMKSWITYVTPTQAFLVLIMATKKETPNLVRYRPLVLQGIAVNRISRVSELNMEIEVIENENFNKLPQFFGTNGLPESLENRDALLEELIWIAKTTASDYQKTFDECSERHIRSLLEKRKILNPSYLRVMARYVGLGLLKNSK